MKNFLNKALGAMSAFVTWYKVPSHRKKFYVSCAAVAPVLVALGFLTTEQTQHILDLISGVLLLGGGSLAAKNVSE